MSAQSKRHYEKMKTKPAFRLKVAVRAAISAKIRRASKSRRGSFPLLGYTVVDLMQHLEAKFQPGMSWENYGRFGWHIDHIRPLASFSYDTPDDPGFKQAWALSNLQPLWAIDNWRKGAKWALPDADAAA